MGKYLTALIGAGLIALGVWGIRASWPALWFVVQGVAPVFCLIIGSFALMIGLAEIWDTLSDHQPSDTPPPPPR